MPNGKKLKLATWNINSIRIRLTDLKNLTKKHSPDIIALQEIKCANDAFPMDDVKKLGYEHVIVNGQKAYHGVAILSKIPIEQIAARDFNKSNDTRHLAVKIKPKNSRTKHPLILHNFYFPAGGDIPDRSANPKFGQKLDYLTNLTKWFKSKSDLHSNKMILVGDLNIAPLPTDVWSHKQLLKVVSHTPIEVDHLSKLQSSLNWHDVMRQFVHENEPLYTWWSYRAKDWRSSNKGRRLDHIWVTPSLAKSATSMQVVDKMRDGAKTSDHAPVIAEFEI